MGGATQPRAGRRRVGRAGLAATLAAAAALLVPSPSPDAQIAQGLGRLLRDDALRARAGEGGAPGVPSPPSLLAALARASPSPALGLELRVDGRRVEAPALERAARTAIRSFQEHTPAGLPRLPELAGPGTPPRSFLVLSLRLDGSLLVLDGSLRGPAGERPLPRIGPWRLPGRVSLLPPLVAVGAALLWQRVLWGLFLGIASGAIARAALAGAGIWAPLAGLVDIFRVYLWREFTDAFRIQILGFIVALLAMVGVMSRSGGVRGLVDRALVLARSVRSGLVLTWGAGLLIFFDDYANCMLVGSTLRPLTDRLRISREKLAFVVDSTAAPVAGVSLLSTWIAFQVSVFSPQLPAAGIEASGYAVFVQALPYRFYCWLMIFFVLAVALSGRDFGPMARAEARARRSGALLRFGARVPRSRGLAAMEPAPAMPTAARRALVPLFVTCAATGLAVLLRGGGLGVLREGGDAWLEVERWRHVLLEGAGADSIFAGALAGLACAIFLAGSKPLRWALAGGAAALAGWSALGGGRGGGIAGVTLFAAGALASGGLARARGAPAARPFLPAAEILRAAASSGPTLGYAAVLLFEAWMIGAVCADLATADYLAALLAHALPAFLLPVLLFVVSGLVAFATGSSWSTMSILLPNAVPLAAALAAEAHLAVPTLVALVIAAVLDGSIFGDHCSPISDTTVLSSVASGSDHWDHVRTQLPYAVAVAVVAIGAGYLPILLWPGWGAGCGLAAGALGLVALLALAGRAAPEAEVPDLDRREILQ